MNLENIDVYNTLGTIGACLYFLSYALLTMQKIKGESYTYILMNFMGASLVLFSLIKYWNLPSAIIQIGWVILSLIGIANLYFKNKPKSVPDL